MEPKKTKNERITIDDQICNGKPTIRGMRITVQTILEFVLAGSSNEEILIEYPILENADIDASKQFAMQLLDRKFTIKEMIV